VNALNITSPEKLQGLVTCGDGVGVGVIVGVGVGVYPLDVTDIPLPPQGFDGDGLGVGVGVGVLLGVGVGDSGTKQSNNASKSNVAQGSVVVVVVTQVPSYITVSSRSGSVDALLYEPN
jgi:hypothetical protein